MNKGRSGRVQATTSTGQESSEQLKPAHQDADLLAVRTSQSRDSGVSSRNSSVTYDHDFMGPSDVFPPAPENLVEPEHVITAQSPPLREHLLPPPLPEEDEAPAKLTAEQTVAPGHSIVNQKTSFLAVLDEAKEPVCVRKEQTTTGRSPSPAVPHAPEAVKKSADSVTVGQASPEHLSEDSQQLVALAKSILGEDAATEEVFVIDLVRPDGSTGGGVGMVLTGGADYEVNQIKVKHATDRFRVFVMAGRAKRQTKKSADSSSDYYSVRLGRGTTENSAGTWSGRQIN